MDLAVRDSLNYIVNFYSLYDTLLVTDDGGVNWHFENHGVTIEYLHFPSSYIGFASGTHHLAYGNTKLYKVTYPRPVETGDLPDSVYYMVDGETLSVEVPFSVSAPFHGDNLFTASLSSADGSWEAPVQVGSLTADSASSLSITLPADLPPGECYKVRIDASSPAETGSQSSCFAVRHPADTCQFDSLLLGGVPFVVSPSMSDTALITFSAGCTFGEGNVFTAWLSSPGGTWEEAVSIGTLAAAGGGTLAAILPATLESGDCYKVRIMASDPAAISGETPCFAIAREEDSCTLMLESVSGSPFAVSTTQNDTAYITFSSTCAFGSGNTFTAWLTRAAWEDAVSIGSLESDTPGTLTCILPAGLASSGNYTVRVVSSYPMATSNPSAPFTITLLTGMEKHEKQIFILYPNPAGDQLTVSTNKEISTYKIIDATGRLVDTQEGLGAGEFQVKTRHLAAGLYTMVLIGKDGTIETQLFEKQ